MLRRYISRAFQPECLLSRLNGCKIRRDYISDTLCISLFPPPSSSSSRLSSRPRLFHSVRDVALALFHGSSFFGSLSCRSERKRGTARSGLLRKRRAVPCAVQRSFLPPFIFFPRSSRWKPSAHGRDRGTCTERSHRIEGDLEMPRRCVRLRAAS